MTSPGFAGPALSQQAQGLMQKTSWRTQSDFIDHWYSSHAKPLHKRWTYLARDIQLSPNDLAVACLGVNLDDCPLPATSEGLKCVPKGFQS